MPFETAIRPASFPGPEEEQDDHDRPNDGRCEGKGMEECGHA
jgi:hypothetical protein